MNKQGRKPVTQRTESPTLLHEEVFGNFLKIEPDLQAELESKGLVARFVDAKKLYEMNGYHKNGWVPYKRDANAKLGLSDFKFGTDPDGIVRRGTLILAVKSVDQVNKHKAALELKANRGRMINKTKADELRDMVRSTGTKTQVHEGYEENE